ncbi:MAG: Tll0287-like domain-containing protein, partial [Burkholderiaceae bacterium]
DNEPNRFELEDLKRIRSDSNKKEYIEVSEKEVLYARAIVAGKACLICHDTPANAPVAVRTKYPALRGYGYKEGAVIGVTSVRVPLDSATKTVMDNLSMQTWGAIAAFFGTLMVIMLFVRSMVIAPVRRLELFAHDIRDTDPEVEIMVPKFVENEYSSRNEIHQLSHALKAVREAMKIYGSGDK